MVLKDAVDEALKEDAWGRMVVEVAGMALWSWVIYFIFSTCCNIWEAISKWKFFFCN